MTAIPRPAHDRGGADAVSGGRDQGRVIRPPSSAILALLGCGRRHDSWLVVSPRVCQHRGVAPAERAEFWRNTLVKRYEPIGPAMRCTRATTTPWPKYVAGQLRQTIPRGHPRRKISHCERHLASQRRDGPWRNGELEGFDRCATFPSVLRISALFGAFDVAPTDLMPTYELWVARREKWFRVAMTTQQFPGDLTEVV
jgi:hypothetical protein